MNDVFMYAAIALDKMVKDYLDFIATKRSYVEDRIMRASHIKEETYESICAAVDDTLRVMRDVEDAGTGDTTGHRLRQKKVAEIKSILHIARAFPGQAVRRLKVLPEKKLLNV